MKKLTYKYVKDLIELEGHTLLSTEYINSKTDLKIQCSEGHEYIIKWCSWKKGQRCYICNHRKYTIKYIKDQIEQTGYKLLSTKYINTNTKLSIQCPKGHIYSVTYDTFRSGCRCPVCYGRQKFTYKYIKEQIEAINGYKLLIKKYKNSQTKLDIQCSEGHIFKMRYNNFQQGQRCPYCAGKAHHTYKYIKNYLEMKGFKLLSKKYKNALSDLKIQCPEDHIFKMRYNSFQQGQRCPQCLYIDGKSKAEKEVLKVAKSFTDNIIIENDRTQIVNPKTGRYLELDLWIPDLKKAIEFNGEFWHSSKYSKYKDQQKVLQCLNKDINLLVIQEQEWLYNKEDCINNIKNFLEV